MDLGPIISVGNTPPDASYWHDILVGGIGFVGALIGAAVGALMTGSITRRLTRGAREDERTEQDMIGAFSMRQQLTRIYSSALTTLAHIKTAKAREAEFEHPHVSLLMEAFANTGEKVRFTIDELMAVERIGGNDLLNKVGSLDAQHNAIRTALKLYRERRIALTDQLSGPMEDGTKGAALMTAEEYEKHKPRLAELDATVNQLLELNSDLYDASFDALKDLIAAQGSKLGMKFKMEFNRLDGEPLTIESQPSTSSTEAAG